MQDIVLENRALRLRFALETGCLIGLEAVETGWHVIDRPDLGLSFRLLAPLPGRRENPVHGESQTVTTATFDSDQQGITFVWDGVESVHGGRLDITVTERVRLTERQAIVELTVRNNSPYTVENVYAPYLGDAQPPEDGEPLSAFSYNYGSAQDWPLWPTFLNRLGYYGVDYPTQFGDAAGCGAPMTPFVLLRSSRQGLYMGVHAPSAELVAWHAELRPGYRDALEAQVPRRPTIEGHDVSTRVAAVHVPYILPGETRTLTPIALEAYQGGWQQGVDCYTAWRTTWMKPAVGPRWTREPHAWLQVRMNSPEDDLRYRYSDLPGSGEECARLGVGAIQVVGWNHGGQDQNNPSHVPDPRLGAFDELREAIAHVQALGVRVILFCKFTWADRATERFRDDLIRLSVKDPHGDYYHYPGYRYQTATQLLDINTKRLIPMCFLAEEYLRVCEDEFRQVLALHPDGILFDECQHHGPALLCFDQHHGHRPGAPVYANDRLLIQRLSTLAAAENTEFLFAGEACYDWEMEAYHLAYFRSENRHHVPLSRYMLPDEPYMSAVTGFDDRNMINQCLLYRYIISYEPYNFKGRLGDFPLTVAYGRQMDALRTDLRSYLWDGAFHDTVGAQVTDLADQQHHPYSVFSHPETGRCCVVVANYEVQRSATVRVALTSGRPLTRYRLVDDPQWLPVGETVEIPPRSAVVMLEGD